jgi:hypothetical protein
MIFMMGGLRAVDDPCSERLVSESLRPAMRRVEEAAVRGKGCGRESPTPFSPVRGRSWPGRPDEEARFRM